MQGEGISSLHTYNFHEAPLAPSLHSHNRDLAQKPLEPFDGFLAVRKRMAPPPKNDVNGFIWLPIKWLQWLLRNLANVSNGSYRHPTAPPASTLVFPVAQPERLGLAQLSVLRNLYWDPPVGVSIFIVHSHRHVADVFAVNARASGTHMFSLISLFSWRRMFLADVAFSTGPTRGTIGPVGLVIAYQLARFGCKPYLLGTRTKPQIEQEGKADMACYGRAATMWPRTMEILDQLDLADGLLQIGIVTRDSMHFQDRYGVQICNATSLQVRQRWTEEHFTGALSKVGVQPHTRARVEGFSINEASEDGYPITVQSRDLDKDEGVKSTVRSLAGIPFNGERTTNHPDRWACQNEPSEPPALLEKNGGVEGVIQQFAAIEAFEALKPFNLEFLEVDWFTLYVRFSQSPSLFNPFIFLVDFIRVWAKPSLRCFPPSIASFLRETHVTPTARGQRRDWIPCCEPIVEAGAKSYLNLVNTSAVATITPGQRGPAVYLSSVGTGSPIRLHQVVKNEAKFQDPILTRAALGDLGSALNGPGASTHSFSATRIFRFTTLTAATGISATDVRGGSRFGGGRLYFDPEAHAHTMYGVDVSRGAIVVF
ncbi:hypothetical protein C8R43DRAFT_955871 [Mycena crocata]|nr:hypothetical protein C8R43DRAFT_955871 [Mycena crocata]